MRLTGATAGADFCDVKLVQVGILMDELDKIAHAFARYPPPLKTETGQPPPSYSDGTKIPTIVCGDYNSVPRSGVYEYLSAGSLPPDHHKDIAGKPMKSSRNVNRNMRPCIECSKKKTRVRSLCWVSIHD